MIELFIFFNFAALFATIYNFSLYPHYTRTDKLVACICIFITSNIAALILTFVGSLRS